MATTKQVIFYSRGKPIRFWERDRSIGTPGNLTGDKREVSAISAASAAPERISPSNLLSPQNFLILQDTAFWLTTFGYVLVFAQFYMQTLKH
jgi:hypothetical protein